MHSTISFSLLAPLILLSFLPYLPLSLAIGSLASECTTTGGSYTTNSTYETNLESLFSSLSTESVKAVGFSKNTSGAAPDQVYGLVLCRGDTNYTDCSSCIDQATQDVVGLCPTSKEAFIWYDYCFLHYSNEEIVSSFPNNSLELLMWNTQNVSTQFISGWSNDTIKLMFTSMVETLLYSTSEYVITQSIKRLFSTGMMSTPTYPVIYSLAQCNPDMLNRTCNGCLAGLVEEIQSAFGGRKGARILGDRCCLRYETYKFYPGNALYSISSGSTAATSPQNPPQGERCKLILSSIIM